KAHDQGFSRVVEFLFQRRDVLFFLLFRFHVNPHDSSRPPVSTTSFVSTSTLTLTWEGKRYTPTEAGSIRIPGPIVVATFTFLTYLPFAVAGLALITASISAFAFAVILSAENETLPTGT